VLPDDPPITRTSFETLDVDGATALVRGRFAAASDAGCSTEDAIVIAVHPEIGLEDALRLLRRGCPARTVLRILL
jgi:hypothetical protein